MSRLDPKTHSNTFVADCLMYGGNAANFNPHGLDTTGWISSNALSAGAGRSLYRRFNGHDTDQVMDWQYTSSPTSNSSADIPDSDGDGLTDQEELTGSLNPYGEPTDRHNADSDGDGLSDYAECITHGTNPNTWATDGDIFPWPPPSGAVSDWWGSDPYEIANGWNPLVLDENANGIPDSWEMAFPGTNLYADADGDGISNYDELAQNSDPNDINSTMAQPYVIRYESSLPGWVNDGMTDIGLEGWVKTYFEGLKADMDLCVWVKEGRTQEEFRVVWRGATEKGVHWLSDQEVVTSASAGADTRPYLFVQDLGMHPDYTNTLGGEYKMAVLSVDITFADPDDSGWADLEERKVILSDKDTRIKIKITPQLNDLQTIFDALGTTLKIKTSETAPSGQDFTLTAQNTTLTQGSGYSELRVALTRAQLISLGVLPSQESDSVTEKAWIDHGSSSSSDPSNLTDGEAFESGSSAETRGRSTNYGDLESTPPNSPVDETFFIAAGREVLTAEYSCGISHKRQLMNQADYFYYSGHGGHDTAVLQGGFSASDVTGYWDKDMHYVVLAGCSVLDIKDYRAQSFGLGTWLQWYAARGAWSPGAQWEPTGPKYFLGYNWSAPLDNQGSAGIISNFLSALGGGASIVDAWKQANDLGVGRNACVIDANSSPHVYWYWDETSGTPVWTNVTKSGGSW